MRPAGGPASNTGEALPLDRLEAVDVPPGQTVEQVVERLSRDPAVEYAEPDRPLVPLTSDTFFGSQWGLENDGRNGGVANVDVDATAAWQVTRGAPDVVVAVIDTGIQIDHPDLQANIWTNAAEANGVAGVDDDHNGYVDDVHGWDFLNNDATIYDGDGTEHHGTHVAGIIAAVADNGRGVAGLAPNVKIMPLKFMGPTGSGGTGGSTENAVKALDYAKRMGATVVNASFGVDVNSTALRQAIADAGLVVAAASGNAGQNVDGAGTKLYPAAYTLTNIVSVTAVDRAGTLPSFSNYGATSVDVGAPGVDIGSTFPDATYPYQTMSGTSMAAPFVAATAALVATADRTLSASSIASIITSTAVPLPALAGTTTTGGMVNAEAAVVVAARVPPEPRNVTGSRGDGTVTVSWQPPVGSPTPVTGYTVTLAGGGTTVTKSTAASVTTTTLGGLANGTTYTASVSATNSAGTGPSTPGIQLAPATAPGRPTAVTATGANTRVDVTWQPPASDGGSPVRSYTVTATPDTGSGSSVSTTVAAPGVSGSVPGLTNGVAYTVAVTARNDLGDVRGRHRPGHHPGSRPRRLPRPE